MTKKDELKGELLKDVKNPDDLFGKEGLLKQLTKPILLKEKLGFFLKGSSGIEWYRVVWRIPILRIILESL